MTSTRYPLTPVMLVDDEADILKSFEITLKTGGVTHILTCNQPKQVMSLVRGSTPCLILLDLSMPYMSGEDLLSFIKDEHPDIPVIVITGDNEVETAVRCMKKGAVDYMVKPVEKNRLISGVRKVIEIRELQHENQMLKERMLSGVLCRPEAFSEIVTNNKVMVSLFQYAESIAPSPQPVLISGETGVGKELMAKAIHILSGRTGDIITVNAAGIDDNVFADTLFGHVKGAYTGADQARTGLVEKAFGGTLVLDEIGDLTADSQIKLLRLIQEGEYFPLGSDVPKKTNVRIIVSTNKDLQVLQSTGEFRKDLYFRLKAHHIIIPPLRKRLDDITILLDHFLDEAARHLGKKKPAYPEQLITLLQNYAFPGNVRELRTMIYDAVSTHTSKMLSLSRFEHHLEEERRNYDISPEESLIPLAALNIVGPMPTMKQATQILIAEAMKRTNNNQSMAAKLLGITRQTLARNLDLG